MENKYRKAELDAMQEKVERRSLEEAELFLNGMSVTDIGKKYNLSRVTVHKDLTKVLSQVNPQIAKEVYQKLRENHATIDDDFVRQRVLKAYFYLTANNLNTIQIAQILGTTKHIIYRDLTTHLNQMREKYPSIVTDDMIKNVQTILTQHSMQNIKKGNS